MNRRSVLSNITPGVVNASRPGPPRPSVGPGRVSNAKVARPTMGMGRLSTVSNRKSSVGGIRRSSVYHRGSTTKVTDPRNVTDKGVVHRNVEKLISYLTQHDYDRPLSPKALTAPTTKDFMHIFEFLAHRVDPLYVFGPKLEDEVPLFFRRVVCYPITINKSALFSVGSPLTWPHLLAALVWLVDLLSYEEGIALNRATPTDVEEKFFIYLCKTYTAFMSGEDNLDVLEEQLQVECFARQCDEVESQIETLSRECADAKEKLQAIRAIPSPLAAQVSKKKDLEGDIAKFRQVIEDMKGANEAQRSKLEPAQRELEQREEEIAQLQRERQELEQVIQTQEVNQEEYQRMLVDRATLENALTSTTQKRELAQSEAWDMEIRISRKLDEVERSVAAFNTAGHKLKLLPANAKYANGENYELHLTSSATSIDKMLNVNIRGILLPALGRLKETIKQKQMSKQVDLLKAKEVHDRLEEAYSEKEDEVTGLQGQLQTLEAQYKRAREACADDVRRTMEEAESVEKQVCRIKEERSGQLASAERAHQAAQIRFHDVQNSLERERRTTNEAIMQFLNVLAGHKQFTSELLASTEKKAREMVENL